MDVALAVEKQPLVNSRTPLSVSDSVSLWQDGEVAEGQEEGRSGVPETPGCTEHANMRRRTQRRRQSLTPVRFRSRGMVHWCNVHIHTGL